MTKKLTTVTERLTTVTEKPALAWISVDDQPAPDNRVFIFLSISEPASFGIGIAGPGRYIEPESITHWLDLPPPPPFRTDTKGTHN